MFENVNNEGFEFAGLTAHPGPAFHDYYEILPPRLILSEWGYSSDEAEKGRDDENGSLAELSA